LTRSAAFSTLGAMPGHLPVRAWAVASLVLFATAGPATSQQERTRPVIYKWVDINGIAHYTTDPDDIPSELRDRLDEVRRQRPTQPEEPAEPAQPAPLDLDDPWAEVSVEKPDDLWVVQDSLGSPDEIGSDDPFGEDPARDPAAERRRKAEQQALDQRIADLRAQISVDEELLKTWIANPEVDPVMAADDPEFREVALRLPRLHSDLAELEQKRQAMGGAPEEAAP
jgi:hypothetical protein